MKYGLSKENLLNILSVATYGSDWLVIKRKKSDSHLVKEESECREEKWADILLAGGNLVAFVYEDEDNPTKKEFSLEDMKIGFQKFIEECPQDYADLVTGHDDYYTCSNLMQCVLLGEVVFG